MQSRPVSKNKEKRIEYLRAISVSYNEVINYVVKLKLDDANKIYFANEISNLRAKLFRCFGKLNVTADFSPNKLDKVHLESLIDSIVEDSGSDSDNLENETNSTNFEMAITNIEFIGLCAKTISKNYDGNPLARNAFINSIELLKTLCPAEHKTILITFIKTRLEGKALESIPNEPENIDEILDALRTNIKPENSKVISGRMLALRLDNKKVQDFSRQAEELADAFKRSLIVEEESHRNDGR